MAVRINRLLCIGLQSNVEYPYFCTTMKIVTLTLNPALDQSTSVPHFIPEQKLRCDPMQMDAGGGGINVSKGIAKLGGTSIAVFPVGGHNGQLVKELVEKAGITTHVIPVSAETRENIAVTEADTNVQYRFTLPGEPMSLKEADACLEAVFSLKPEILVASGSLPPGLPETYYKKVATMAQEAGIRFILDTSGQPLQAAADQGVFLLKPNLAELSALADVEQLEMDQVDDAALSIIKQGKCEVVVVSLGAQGALLVTKDGFEHIPAPMVKKKSTVGAGDSMVAGMVWALSKGKSYHEMVQTGVACGSAATLNTGTHLFEKTDVTRLLQWIQKYGERYRFTNF
jgi:6-phosphofructokinase 2